MNAEDFLRVSGCQMSNAEAAIRTVAEITEKEWAEIHLLAVRLHESGMFKGNQMKCAIQAFVLWVSANEVMIGEDFTADGGLH